jgi:pyrimidine-nucleoside phosphorylase
MSALGYNIAMLSGRGLGHTGGTLDKLESIPGLNPFLTEKQIKSRLKKTGIAISGQTRNIAPADGKIYALRDLTGTVESIPLITASILSKKLALKTDAIIFDIKVGSGAFMKTRKDATNLARSLLSVCRKFKRRAGCLLTDMSEPLGYQVGNYLEIMETAQFLKTGRPEDMREVTYRLGYEIIRFYDSGIRKKEIYDSFDQAVSDGRALARMVDFVVAAGGRSDLLENPKAFFSPAARGYIKADKAGYLAEYDTEKIGRAALALGAGRTRIEDDIDPMAGLTLAKKRGDRINRHELLFTLYGSSRENVNHARRILKSSYKISQEKIASPKKIITFVDR